MRAKAEGREVKSQGDSLNLFLDDLLMNCHPGFRQRDIYSFEANLWRSELARAATFF